MAKNRDKKKNRNSKKRLFQGDDLQKRIKKNQQKSQGRVSSYFKENAKLKFWRPKNTSHIIDIIPYLAGKRDPNIEEGRPAYTFEFLVHNRVGNNDKSFICPSMFDKKCPICEYRNMLREKGDEAYKNYFPQTRNLYNVIVHDDKAEKRKGVQIFDVAYFYFEKHLMSISKKPSRDGKEEKTVNFVHPENGKSVCFEIQAAKSKDDYPSYVGHSFDDRNYEIDEDILDEAFILDELVTLESYDTIKKAFFEFKEKNDDDSNDNNNAIDFDELFDELNDAEDNDDLEDIADKVGYDDLDEDGKFRKEKKKLKEFIEKLKDKNEEDESEPDDDNDPEYDKDDIEEMSYKELKKLVKKEDLDVDVSDFDKDDEDDLDDFREAVIDELGLDD